MLTYLDLCNTMIVELGINGGQKLTTVQPGGVNSLESERVCSFIADADYEIQSLHHNWKFLWKQFNGQLAAGFDVLGTPQYRQNTYPGPSGQMGAQTLYQFRKIDRESMVFNYDKPGIMNRPVYQPWRKFETLWQNQTKSISNSPPYWSQTPQGNPIVSTVMQAATNYRYECWARPFRLQSDGDISPLVRAVMINDTYQNIVPPQLIINPSGALTLNQLKIGAGTTTAPVRNESCRIVIVRAKVIWAEVEGATEVMQGALAEYQDLLEELRADQLPGMEHDRVSENDVPMTVETI